MTEIRARIAGPLPTLRGMPAILAAPDVGAISVPRVRTVVVFPAPFGPRKPKISPRGTDMLNPASAVTAP